MGRRGLQVAVLPAPGLGHELMQGRPGDVLADQVGPASVEPGAEKPGGKSRSAAAILSNGASVEPRVATWRRAPSPVVANIFSTAWFSRLNSLVPGRERLGIGTLHLRPQLG